MDDFRIEAELKAGNVEQKILSGGFFVAGIGMTIIAGMMINSLYRFFDYSYLNHPLFHLFIVDLCFGFIVWVVYKIRQFYLKSSKIFMTRQYRDMQNYINKKYRSKKV
jgi:hypothetical protein